MHLSPSLTIREAIASNTPAIGLLSKIVQNGNDVVIAIIVEAITDLNKFFNFSDTGYMTTAQISETSKMIFKDYNSLKIEDIRVCFNNGKKGHYGQLYNRLDGQIIMMWFQQYWTDRTNEYLRIKDFNEQQERNKKLTEINPEGQKKVIEILKESIKPVEAKKEPAKREKTDQEKLIQRFYNQFTKIAVKRGLDDNTRFIFMYGKPIDANKYVEIKLNQYYKLKNIKR